MKKLLSLALAILMLCTLFLTSCSDKRTDDEIMEDIVKNSKRIALTLSVMIPTDADTSSPEFQKRLAAVEEAINTILRQDCTEVKLIAVNDKDYDKAVADKMGDIKSKLAAGGTRPSSVVFTNQAYKKYVNGVDGEYTIQLKYPEIMDTQVDVILMRSYDDFMNYASNGQLKSLKDYIAPSGSYNRINKIVKADILNKFKIGDETYGIPNNHLYSNGLYQYVAIDKSVAAQVENFNIESLVKNGKLDYSALSAFMTEAAKLENVLPLVAKESDAPSVSFWGDDDFSLISSSVFGDKAPVSTFANNDYTSFMSLYKKFNSAADEDSKVAVSYKYLTPDEMKAASDAYYFIETEKPVINEENAFESVFAVTNYSVNFDRAMEFIYNLQTDEEIRTLLQYGIKGEDYQLEDGVLEMIKDNKDEYAYKMNPLYTGNGYITYPGEGLDMDLWDVVKDINYDSVVNPYFGMETFYADYSKKADVDAAVAALKTLNDTAYAKISAMTAEEFDVFVAEWSVSVTTNEDVLAIRDSEAFVNAMTAFAELYAEFAGAAAAAQAVTE